MGEKFRENKTLHKLLKSWEDIQHEKKPEPLKTRLYVNKSSQFQTIS